MRSETVRRVGTLLALGCVLLLPTGCNTAGPGDVGQPDQTEPPEIPPQSTMLMDFDDFTTGQNAKTLQFTPGFDWLYAAGNVAVWNSIVTVTLVVPVAAFVESFEHQPERQEDGTWVWSYSFDAANLAHSAELHAKAVDGDIEWKMFVSREGSFEDVLWFTGVSDLVGTQGTWTLNRDPDDVEPFILIEWERDADDETASIRYTNIVPEGPENGGYIFAGRTDDATHDRFYEIYNKGQDNLTDIEWGRSTLAGRVRDPRHFGDDDWHCWDNTLANSECPSPE